LPLKRRLDLLVVERGLADSREKAQALIMAGLVLVDDQPATKAGANVAVGAVVRLKAGGLAYVSRGGLKIEGAVAHFGLDVRGRICVDVRVIRRVPLSSMFASSRVPRVRKRAS